MNYLYYLLLGLFWSASFLAIKIAVNYFPPTYSALFRVLIAQIVFAIIFICLRTKLKIPFAAQWRAWVVGIFSIGLPFSFLFWGEQSVTPAMASIINGTVAAWSLLFNIVIFKDYSHATFAKISGLCLGLLGIIVIFAPMLGQGSDSKLLGLLSVTGMAISYAIGGVLNHRLMLSKWRISIQANLWQQFWASLAFLLILALIFEPRPNLHILYHAPQVSLALLYLGVCSTAIAWILYMKLIHAWGAVCALSVMYLVPILTMLWDYLFFNLKPSIHEVYGVIIILIGVALIQFTKKREIIE